MPLIVQSKKPPSTSTAKFKRPQPATATAAIDTDQVSVARKRTVGAGVVVGHVGDVSVEHVEERGEVEEGRELRHPHGKI